MRHGHVWIVAALPITAVLLLLAADSARVAEDRLWRHRNLGKAFYENPTTQAQAVEEFKKALDLAPGSARERLNYGLALLRAGRTQEAVAEIEKAQKQDSKIPHTWFNLGIAFKKEGQYDRAAQQFEQMIRLAPDEPVSHYNLAVLHKLNGKTELALKHFETAARLNPNLAGPHFQLYNAYRQAGRSEDAARELKTFQEIKKRNEGAAVPEDMEWSYYSEIYETVEPKPDTLPPADLKFQQRQIADHFDAGTAGLLVLDADGDGRPDLLAWSSSGVKLFRNGSTPVANSGLAELKDVIAIAAGDFDNDGLPDLCVVSRSGSALYHNNKGTFQKHAAKLPEGRYKKALWIDFDHDYDLDLVLLGDESALLRNNGQAGFSEHTTNFPFVAGSAVDGVVFDRIADTNGTDIAVSYGDRGGVLYRDKLAGKYEAVPLDVLPAGSTSLVASDLNRDGWTDLVFSEGSHSIVLINERGKLTPKPVGTASSPVMVPADFENRGAEDLLTGDHLYRNQGLGRFEARKTPLAGESTAIAVADFDGDGRLDLARITADGVLHLLRNETVTRNHWMRIGLTGVKNLKLAPAAQVEVKAGSLYQKKIYQGLPLVFGMNSFGEADTVRITWPNGLIQNEPKQPAGKPLSFKEAQRLSGSCPMIFTWNGKKFEFITDVLGVAPLGASSGDGTYFPVDHDEYVQIPGESLAPVDGEYEIRITEELREVSYLDQIRLLALDHPFNMDVFTNEKFKGPPFPEFRLYGVRQRIYPKTARDHHGHDVLAQVVKRDRTYADDFRRDYSGAAEMHSLDLDFGAAAPDNRAVLVLNGWVDWADASTFARGGLVFPYLQVKNAAGQWQTVIEDMGIPAGKPKTIVVDLSGKFASKARAVRIVTNLCVYWDEIFLAENDWVGKGPASLDLLSADLRFRGFSKARIDPERKQPESFDYSHVLPVSMWNPTPGHYTRYGDVRPLLESVDDRMVIMGSGDELRLRFSARNLPPAPMGWKRDFLLFVDGWAKDGDANTAYSQTVDPLPFHGMSVYQPYPEDVRRRGYRQQYNTRPALRLLRPLP